MSGATLAAARDETGERSLGLATCTALVIGNMVGSGFFIAPAALARFGTTALIGWAVMSVGALPNPGTTNSMRDAWIAAALPADGLIRPMRSDDCSVK